MQEALIMKVTDTVRSQTQSVVKMVFTGVEVTVSPAESETALKSHQTASFSFDTQVTWSPFSTLVNKRKEMKSYHSTTSLLFYSVCFVCFLSTHPRKHACVAGRFSPRSGHRSLEASREGKFPSSSCRNF